MKLKDGFVSFIKGVIMGISSLIPGISSGSMAISLSAYEHVIEAINNIFKKHNRKLFLIVIPIILGILAGIFGGAHLTEYFLTNFKPQTIFLFIGLMAGGYRLIIKNQKLKLSKKSTIIFLILFILTIIIHFLVIEKISIITKNTLINNVFLGLLTGLIIFIPGISNSSILLLFNKYEYIILQFKNIFTLNNFIFSLVFIISFLIGLIIFCKIIYHFIKKYKEKTYLILSALLTASIVIATFEIKIFTFNFVNIFTTILAFLWGYIFAKNVEKE